MVACLTLDQKVACLIHVGFISRYKDIVLGLMLWPAFCVLEAVRLTRDKKVAWSIHI